MRPETMLVGAVLFLSIAPPRTAAADPTKYQCVEADTAAQSLQKEGKFAAARAELRTCADAHCPDAVRVDCAARQETLEGLQPNILFDVKDTEHHDVLQVSVSMDGQKLADKLGGVALSIDPGPHRFTFQAPGHPVTTADYVIHEGEKLRMERIVLVEPSSAPVTPSAPVVVAPTEGPQTGFGTQRIAGLAIGGAGVAGVAVGAVFGLLTSAALSKSKSECTSTAECVNRPGAASEYQTATTDGTISTVAFIAGGVLLAGGIALFVTAPAKPRATEAHNPGLTVAVLPGLDTHGGSVLLRAIF